MALITQTEAREAIPSLTADATVVSDMISRLGTFIARYLGYPAQDATEPTIEQGTFVFYYDEDHADSIEIDGERLRLPIRPVASIASIYDDVTGAETYGASSLVASTNYALDIRTGVVRLLSTSSWAWSGIDRAIKVTCVAGFATIPGPIKQAAILTVANTYRNRAVKAEEQGTEFIIPPAAKELLQPYRIMSGLVRG